jgi:hypothetical protein
VLEPRHLTAAALRREVQAVLGTPRPPRADRAAAALGFDGARRAAAHLFELAQVDRGAAPARIPSAV